MKDPHAIETGGNPEGIFDRERAEFFLVVSGRAIKTTSGGIEIVEDPLDCIGAAAREIYDRGERCSLWAMYMCTAPNPYLKEELLDKMAGYFNEDFNAAQTAQAEAGGGQPGSDSLVVGEEV